MEQRRSALAVAEASCPVSPATRLRYLGATSARYGATVPVAVLLTDGAGLPLQGQAVSLAIGGAEIVAETDANGVAAAPWTAAVDPADVVLTATFVGNAAAPGAAITAALRVVREDTLVRYTGNSAIATSGETVSAVLRRPDLKAIAGRTLTFQVGGASASGVTDESGVARATLSWTGAQPNGPADLVVSFAGDADYQPSSATLPSLLYQRNAFVLWDGNASPLSPGARVNFWGAQWADQVHGGDYDAEADFKGFANTAIATGPCEADARTSGAPSLDAGCWTTKPGNAFPPASLPGYVGVFLSTSIAKGEGFVYGNVSGTAVVKVEPGYGPVPGKPGWGTLVSYVAGGANPALTARQSQPETVLPGAPFEVALDVTNAGTAAASAVSRTSRAYGGASPATGTSSLGTLAAGATVHAVLPFAAPLAPARGADESADQYAARLAALDAQALGTATAISAATPAQLQAPVADVWSSGRVRLPRLSVALSAPPCVTPGEAVSYRATVFNLGSAEARDVRVTVAFPDGSSGTVTLGAVAAGASAEGVAAWQVPLPAPKAAGESNAAYGSRLRALDGSALPALASANWSDEAAAPYGAVEQPARSILRVPVLTVAADATPQLLPGEQGQIVFHVVNIGSAVAVSPLISVTGSDGSSSTGSLASLGAGQSGDVAITVTAPAAAPDGSRLTFSYALTWDSAFAAGYGPLTGSTATDVVRPVLSLTLSSPAVAGPGDAIAFGAALLNSGHADAVNAIVNLKLPDGSNATLSAPGTLAAGASAALSLPWKLPVPAPKGAAEPDADYLTRLRALDGAPFAVSGAAFYLDARGDSYSTDGAPASGVERLAIVEISALPLDPVLPGQEVALRLSLRNTGSAATPRATAQVVLGDGTVRESAPAAIAPGQTAEVTTATVAPAAPGRQPGESSDAYLARLASLDGGPISFAYTVSWTSAAADVYGPLQGLARTTEIVPVLRLSLSGPPDALPGDGISDTVRVTNTGHATANAVRGHATLPDGSSVTVAVPGSMAPGTSADATVSWTVSPAPSRAASGSSDAYLARLRALDGAALTTAVALDWTDAQANAYGDVQAATTATEHLPILILSLSIPAELAPGAGTALSANVQNDGSADALASALRLGWTGGGAQSADGLAVPAGQLVAVPLSAVVPALAVRADGESEADYLARLRAADGSALDFSGSVTWADARGGAYGAVDAAAQAHEVLPIVGISMSASPGVGPAETLAASATLINSGHAVANASVRAFLPDGSALDLAAAGLAPGASATLPLSFAVPALSARSIAETNDGYLARLSSADGTALLLRSELRWTDLAGAGYGALSAAAQSIVHVPVVHVAAGVLPALGPGQVAQLALTASNSGTAPALSLGLALTQPDGTSSTSGPLALEPGESRVVLLPAAAPGLPARNAGETDAEWLARVAALDGSALSFPWSAAWSGPAQPYGTLAGPADTLLVLPVLSLSIDAPAAAGPGEPLAYTVTVHNAGHAAATAPALRVALPDGTIAPVQLADLAAGGSASQPVFGAVPVIPPRGASESSFAYLTRLETADRAALLATAALDFRDAAGNAYTGLAAQAVTVEQVPVLLTQPRAPIPQLLPGETRVATYDVTNEGTGEARDAQLAVTSTAAAHASAPVVTAGRSVPLDVQVVAPSVDPRGAGEAEAAYVARLAALDGSRVRVDATLDWADAAGNPYGRLAQTSTALVGLPRLSLSLAGPATANSGDDLTYTVTCANSGLAAASAIAITLVRPDGTTRALQLPATDLAPGQSFTATVIDPLPQAQPSGAYTMSAAAAWRDALANAYGPVTGAATTQVTRTNLPPVVNAGPPQTVTLGTVVVLAGTATDDNYPGPLTTRWIQLGGPGRSIFGDDSRPATTVNLNALGTYVLRLTASDGQLTASSDVAITVVPPPGSGTTFTPGGNDGSTLVNVVRDGEELRLDNTTKPFNFIWVAVSTKGTAVKIDTETGRILGEYWTSPNGQPRDPSRTTVDKNGNVWVTNRAGHSITRIGLKENGGCIDRNGNGIIDTSNGFGDIRAWTNAGGADTNGGVTTAADECVINYALVHSSGTRHVAVDQNNDVWVSGTGNRIFDLLDGRTAQIKRTEGPVGYGGYGGLIDDHGVIWSSNPLLRWDTALPLNGANGGNWKGYSHDSYGLCKDSQGNVWNTSLSNNQIRKFSPAGVLLGTYGHGSYYAQGCVVDKNDDVWVAGSLYGNTVGHLKNNGTFVGNVTVQSGPTGVAVDAKGRIWATNYNSGTVSRIDPNGGAIGGDGVTRIGAVDFNTQYLGGNPYNYSDMTGSTLMGAPPTGTYSAVFDSGSTASKWGHAGWGAQICGDASLTVTAATSNDGATYGAAVAVAPFGTFTAPDGRYVKMNVAFQRSSKGESPYLYSLTVGTIERVLTAPDNAAPVVSAGSDFSVTYPMQARVTGSACDDALPAGKLVLAWTQVSGPGTVTFSAPAQEATDLTFPGPGTWVLQLSASDTALTTAKTVTVTVLPPNNPPVVSAGPDLAVVLPDSAQLAGTASDDGKPDGSTLTVAWSKVSGPGTATFADGASAQTSVSFSAAGTYVLRLTASDGKLANSADVTVVVSPAPVVNNPPAVSAGPNLSISSTAVAAALNGSATDDGQPAGSTLSVTWSKVSGPGTVTFANARAAVTTATFSLAGSYVVQLSATDGSLTSTAQAVVSVASPVVQNQPPAVNPGPNLAIALPSSAVLNGSASDDGLPAGSTLTVGWSKTSGPGTVTFGNPASPQTTATFSATGSYVLRLTASDGQITAWAEMGVAVNAAAPTNRSPAVNAGLSRTITLPTRTLALSGSYTDDGQPAGATYTVAWSAITPPASVSFSPTNALNTNVTFGGAGTYLIRLTVSDSQLAGSADLLVTVNAAPGANQAPVVTVGPKQTITLPTSSIALSGSYTDDGLPAGAQVSGWWDQVSGPGAVTFGGTAAAPTATFPLAGDYALRLTVSDSQLQSSALQYVTVLPDTNNRPPVVSAGPSQTITLPETALLSGTVRDDSLPAGAPLTVQWSMVSGPGVAGFSAPQRAATSASFSLPGTYVLRLTASDTQYTPSSDVTVTVLPQNLAPAVSAGANQTLATGVFTTTLQGTASDDGLPDGSTLAVTWTQLGGAGPAQLASPHEAITAVQFPFPGTYTFRLTATDSQRTSYSDVSVVLPVPPGEVPQVSFATSFDGARITAPTDITGSVSAGFWRIEVTRDGDDTAAKTWTTIAQSTSPKTGVLATLDPTSMLNGTYSVRLTATTTAGDAQTTAAVSVEKNLKIGNVQLQFADLSIPVPGLPITVLRSYDSRDKNTGDFGVGWKLSLSDVRVEKSAVLGKFWEEIKQGNFFFPTYCIEPLRPMFVTITLSTGKTYKFQVKANPECQALAPLEMVDLAFTPVQGTQGSLKTYGDTSGYVYLTDGAIPGRLQLIDPDVTPINPTTFELTTEDGTRYLVDQRSGLQQVTDVNGVTLTVSRNGIQSSAGKSVAFVRDAAGRITTITDPNGASLLYAYDVDGNLARFTDRDGNSTTFSYDTLHDLATITDPGGVTISSNEYDASGKLVGSTDALGKSVQFIHDVSGRRETVIDQLGNTTVYEYDDDGNVVHTVDPLGHERFATWDLNDNKLSETDALGNRRSWTYDARNNKASETDALGNTTSWTYDSLGKILTTTSPLGHAVRNERQAVPVCGRAMATGNLLATVDALGNRTEFTYDCDGNQLTEKDASGHVTSYAVDSAGRVTSSTDAAGDVVDYTWDANGNQTSETRRRTIDGVVETLVTRFDNDASGRPKKVTFADGSSASKSYDAAGKVTAETDTLGRLTSYTYDGAGRLTRTLYPDGTFAAIGYDAAGRKASTTDRAGLVTAYEYDPAGRLTRTTLPGGATRTTEYDVAGRVLAATDELGHRTAYEYDAAGRNTKIVDHLGNPTVFAYDAEGNLTGQTDALGNTVTFRYDASNRLVSTIHPDGTHEDVEYDARGRRSARVDQAGVRTGYGYDALGRLTSVVNEGVGGADMVTTYAYDELGNRVSQTDANGHTTRFAYDALGRRVSRTLPLGQRETLAWWPDGKLKSRTDFNGHTTTFAYDAGGRLVLRTPDAAFAGEPPVSFTYFPGGRRRSMSDASGTTTYSYDAANRLTSKATPEGTLSYAYDAKGNLTGASSDSGEYDVSYAYDTLDRLVSVTDTAHGGTTTYRFDAAGRLAGYTYPNGVESGFTYDALNRIRDLKLQAHAADGTTSTVAQYAYEVAPTGARTGVTELGGRTVAWQYDSVWRLTSETIAGVAGTRSVTYTYDGVGNRLSRTGNLPGLPDQANPYDANDFLLGTAPDANGNARAGNGHAFSYDSADQLTSVDSGAPGYLYDGDGRLVARSLGGSTTAFLIDDQTPAGYTQVVEERSSGAVTRSYLYGPQRISMNDAAGVHYYGYDAHSGVRLLTDGSGTVTDTWDYDAFGNVLSRTGTTANTFLYRGEQWDPVQQAYDLRARWYDPDQGRFRTADSELGDAEEPATLNRFVYAEGNPVNRIDPSGHFSLGEMSISISIQVTLFTMNHPILMGVIGLVINALLPEEVYNSMMASGFPAFEELGALGQGEARVFKLIKSEAMKRFLKAEAGKAGYFWNAVGHGFEKFLGRTMFRGAEEEVAIGIGRHTADFIWKNWVIEVKSTTRIDAAQLRALAEYSRNAGRQLAYVFLTEPPPSVVKAIQQAGGVVHTIF